MDNTLDATSDDIKKTIDLDFLRWSISKNIKLMPHAHEIIKIDNEYEPVILSEDERVNRNQRLLLECEKPRVITDRSIKTIRKTVLEGISRLTSRETEISLSVKVNSLSVNELLNGKFELFSFVSFAYGEVMNFHKITSLCDESQDLALSIINLVSDTSFRSQTNKRVRRVKDLKSAIGIVGVDNCKMIMPSFIFRSVFNFDDKHTRKITEKLWNEAVINANVSRFIFEKNEFIDPSVAILMGFLRSIGKFIIVDKFTACHEESLSRSIESFKREKLIDNELKTVHFPASFNALHRVVKKEEKTLTRRIINSLNWTRQTVFIKDAIIEDLDNTPYKKRSQAGKALLRSKAVSVLLLMEEKNNFMPEYKEAWLEANNLSYEKFDEIMKAKPYEFRFVK